MAAFTASEALEMAMEIEKNGEAFYNEAALRSDDDQLKELFAELAAQERVHYRIFARMHERLTPSPDMTDVEYDEYRDYVRAALDNALFAGPDKALALARQAQERESALRAALGFEKDTLLFFYDLRDMVGEHESEAISRVIDEEKKHVRRLARMLQ